MAQRYKHATVNAMVLGSIPTRGVELLFMNIAICSLCSSITKKSKKHGVEIRNASKIDGKLGT